MTGFGGYLMSLALRLLPPLLGFKVPETSVAAFPHILVTSFFDQAVAVTLAVEIDLKLRDRSYRFQQGR